MQGGKPRHVPVPSREQGAWQQSCIVRATMAGRLKRDHPISRLMRTLRIGNAGTIHNHARTVLQ